MIDQKQIHISHVTDAAHSGETPQTVDVRREWRRRIDRVLLNLRDASDGKKIS